MFVQLKFSIFHKFETRFLKNEILINSISLSISGNPQTNIPLKISNMIFNKQTEPKSKINQFNIEFLEIHVSLLAIEK